MKKVLSISTISILLLSAVYSEGLLSSIFKPIMQLNSGSYCQNLSFNFEKDNTVMVNSGNIRLDFQNYWFNTTVGFSTKLDIGFPYTITYFDKNGISNTLTQKNLNSAQEMMFGAGVCFDLPFSNFVSVNIETGPVFNFLMTSVKVSNPTENHKEDISADFRLGLYVSGAVRLFRDKGVNLLLGSDLVYDLLRFRDGVDTPISHQIALRPFVGVVFKTDTLFGW